MENEFLTPSEVAPVLRVGLSRVYQLIRAGAIPATRIGGAIRIPRAAWERWVQERGDDALMAVGQAGNDGDRNG